MKTLCASVHCGEQLRLQPSRRCQQVTNEFIGCNDRDVCIMFLEHDAPNGRYPRTRMVCLGWGIDTVYTKCTLVRLQLPKKARTTRTTRSGVHHLQAELMLGFCVPVKRLLDASFGCCHLVLQAARHSHAGSQPPLPTCTL